MRGVMPLIEQPWFLTLFLDNIHVCGTYHLRKVRFGALVRCTHQPGYADERGGAPFL